MNIVFGILLLLAIVTVAAILLGFAIASLGRNRRGTSGALSGAALEVQSLLDPGKRHVIEAQQEGDAESDEQGDD